MRLKDFYNILKFLRKTESCIIVRHDLTLSTFGKTDDVMKMFKDSIMHIQVK